MTESKIPMHTCRPQGPTLCKVRSLKYTEISHHSKKRYVLYYKKSVNDGSKAPYSHMSATGADASQGTFFEVYGNITSLKKAIFPIL